MKERSNDVIFGRHPVVEALQQGHPIDKVFLQQGTHGPIEKELRHLTRDRNIPMQMIPKERLERLVRGNHQGVVAFIAAIRYQTIEHVLPMLFERQRTPLLLLVEGVTDVRNFGAISRSAEIFGCDAIVVPRKNSAQVNAEAVKTSAGALLRVPVCREKNMPDAVEYLQQSGIQVFASNLNTTTKITEVDLTVPAALVLGSEAHGISSTVGKQADKTFLIPQKGQTESLNVSVAAGIILYEVQRQRGFE